MNKLDIENETFDDTSSCSGVKGEDVLSSVRRRDWSSLRSLSLRPRGFGEERKYAWPFLIHAGQEARSEDDFDFVGSPMRRVRRTRSSTLKEEFDGNNGRGDTLRSTSVDSHPDEHQIKLDTDRSFVLYGVDDTLDIELQQMRLNNLITSIFRRHPQLSYFQGYHDIITVLFLTLPERNQLLCAEKMSLHRLRDAMGKGLEPLLGLLHILKYLLRLADSDYAALLERNTPLPYFALSNLLTLFSHDVPTLPLIQHVFDYLLCRPPIAVVYLAAAITLERKDEAFRMEREGEEGMLHSLLTSLPGLSDGDQSSESRDEIRSSNILHEDLINPVRAKGESLTDITQPETETEDSRLNGLETEKVESIIEQLDAFDAAEKVDSIPVSSGISPDALRGIEISVGPIRPSTDTESSLQIDESYSATILGSSTVSDLSSSDLRSSESSRTETSSRPASPQSHASSDHAPLPRSSVSLPALLHHADALFVQYPPSHPALHVSEIMGPQSVMFTWFEDPDSLMSDAEAEAVVAHPELIVLPFVDPDEAAAAKEAEERVSGDIRRKLRKRVRRKHFGVRLDKKTVVTGTVVALSVAVAVYSIRTKGNGGVLDVSRSDKTLRKAARVVSGILIGGSERLLETFGW